MDYPKSDIWITASYFLVDEEKKVALCCEKCIFDPNTTIEKLVYIAGEDNSQASWILEQLRSEHFGQVFLIVPSLVQILPSGEAKEKIEVTRLSYMQSLFPLY